MSMEMKSRVQRFLEWAELTRNDEMEDPEMEAQFWESAAGQKMAQAFRNPEHRAFLSRLDELGKQKFPKPVEAAKSFEK